MTCVRLWLMDALYQKVIDTERSSRKSLEFRVQRPASQYTNFGHNLNLQNLSILISRRGEITSALFLVTGVEMRCRT